MLEKACEKAARLALNITSARSGAFSMSRKKKRKSADFIESIKARSAEYPIVSMPTSRSDYLTASCSKHGTFRQIARSFMNTEVPCPQCRNQARRMTTDDFIKKAKKSHGKRFDYSAVRYIDSKTKIKIICKDHGPFHILPSRHISGGGGCVGCKTGRLTSQEFVARSRAIHGNKYRYDKTDYLRSNELVTISCKKHGDFKQLPNNHLSGKEGCKECSRTARGLTPSGEITKRQRDTKSELKAKRLTQQDFIERAIKAHGTYYNLNQAHYITQYDHVTIECPNHGKFSVMPYNFWRGGGCPECSKIKAGQDRRKKPNDFLAECKKVHGNQYDLSGVNYVTAKHHIKPSCHKHGTFSILPNNFLRGTGCPQCHLERSIKTLNLSAKIADIVSRFKDVHGSEYNYSEVKYKRIDKPVTIICQTHGRFEQKPSTHLDGKGCPECGKLGRAKAQLLLPSDVIQRFRHLHGSRFDYSNFEYKSFRSKSEIICLEHGPFLMDAQAHLEGKGCPVCSESKGERFIEQWLKEKKITFIREYSVLLNPTDPLRKRVRFDFFIPDRELLIEFDGEHHFRTVRFNGMSENAARTAHEGTKKRDAAKAKWAKARRLTLVRLSSLKDIRIKMDELFSK